MNFEGLTKLTTFPVPVSIETNNAQYVRWAADRVVTEAEKNDAIGILRLYGKQLRNNTNTPNVPEFKEWLARGLQILQKFIFAVNLTYKVVLKDAAGFVLNAFLYGAGVEGFSGKNFKDARLQTAKFGEVVVSVDVHQIISMFETGKVKNKSDTSCVRFIRAYVFLLGLPNLQTSTKKVQVFGLKMLPFMRNKATEVMNALYTKKNEGKKEGEITPTPNAFVRDSFVGLEGGVDEGVAYLTAVVQWCTSIASDLKTQGKKEKTNYTEGLERRIIAAGLDMEKFKDYMSTEKFAQMQKFRDSLIF